MAMVLVHLNPALQIDFSCDTPNFGIVVVLLHWYTECNESPIANAPKMLMDTQCCYNQVQGEALAVFFRLKKFCKFIYRKTVYQGNADALSHLPDSDDTSFDGEVQEVSASLLCTIPLVTS